MTLFLTGACSFIGQAVFAACEERGIDACGIDLRASDRPGCAVADICDPDVGRYIPEGADAVVHLAAISRDSDSRGRAAACFQANVMGTLNLIEAAKARGVRQFIFASTEWVYDNADRERPCTEDDPIDAARLTSEYALSKFVSEINLRQAHAQGFCPVAILRFGIVYGPRVENWSAVESLLNAVATKDEVRIGSRRTARRFIHVQDIAAGILAARGCSGFEVLNIQGPKLLELGEIAETGAALLGRAPRIVEMDPGNPSIRRISSEKAFETLGWRAAIDLGTGLRSLLPSLGLAAAAPAGGS
jgi:nucleoside-diphosphate-sugar epimerase